MRKSQRGIFSNIDWITVIFYLLLVGMGWINIYASVYNEEHQLITDLSQKYGKQMIWIVTSILLATVILIIDGNFYAAIAWPLWIIVLISLVAVLFFGTEISGSKSWFKIGEFSVQPAEFAKFATAMVLAKYLSQLGIKMTDTKTKIISTIIIITPIILILLENETGVALVFISFILVLYREGLSGNFLLFGMLMLVLFMLALLVDKLILLIVLFSLSVILFLFMRKSRQNIFLLIGMIVVCSSVIYGVDYAYNHLQPHQRKRIDVFLGKEADIKKAGYNVNQSLIAIGSGGIYGKGFLNGTQTKYDFVPEQSTDFIFCTVGEEWGFVGTATVILVFILLFLRILFLAERQRSQFSRIYAYGVVSILFFHLMINIGMTIGLAPVIGIPLPFFSYGGSSLWSFTILLFILVKLDAYRLDILR
ncbi:MAG: rod shape-determining protein RodA [Bacteroidia bacterium]|nr:rod shape-determining protein RodA [Bacteroidia bacterium]MCZ2249806.1 rod shape-determining protein RodA [Bacteroidia bacterium]